MNIVPISLNDANAFVDEHHRHNKMVQGHKFSIALEETGELIIDFDNRRGCVIDE